MKKPKTPKAAKSVTLDKAEYYEQKAWFSQSELRVLKLRAAIQLESAQGQQRIADLCSKHGFDASQPFDFEDDGCKLIQRKAKA